MTLVSPDSSKTFDDTLEDLGGVCLFDYTKTRYAKDYPFLKDASAADWDTLGRRFYSIDKTPAFVRFINPAHERFGSICRINQHGRRSWTSAPTNVKSTMSAWNARKSFAAELHWDKRSSRPTTYVPHDAVEFLPDYEGETVWQFDRDRNKRSELTPAHDRLGRMINVGDFITYILYQFDGGGAAGIYFGNVTKIEIDGSVWAKNVSLSSKDKVGERKVKDNKLITILTEDLMKQLMLAKLMNG